MTDAERILVLAKGATARHAKSAHLWKRAVRERNEELRRWLQSRKAPTKECPLLDRVNA